MVVVVIIGILVAIAIPIYNTVTQNAEKKAVEANLRILDGAVTMYYAENDEYPGTGDTVDAFIEGEIGDLNPGSYSLNTTPTPPRAQVTVTIGDDTFTDVSLPVDWTVGGGT